MKRFSDANVLVTGASRGLGRHIACAFAREGAFVFLGYRVQQKQALETLAMVQAEGGQGALVPFDVTDGAAVDSAVDGMLSQRKTLEVVVNNAAVARDELFAMMQRKSWDEVMRANLDGTFNVCRSVVRHFMARRAGVIVNLASVAAQRASPGQVNYAASKGGVLALTQTLAAELGPYGARVNAVVPGLCDTGMVDTLDKRAVAARLRHLPLRRLGTGADVADAVLFLASTDAAYITGQALVVDGGLTL